MESRDSGADQHRNTQEKNGNRAGRHRLTVRATAGTRTGSTALRWGGADRTQQSGAHKRDPAGSDRLCTLCQKEHGESTSVDRQRSRSGQQPYTTGRQGRHASLVPKEARHNRQERQRKRREQPQERRAGNTLP